ncbi:MULTISPECIES: tRNA (adenosine(37)-N6)-threonylcarbamoyltransferase complex ATPase subunit type 1 TsaE [Cysteiniphilum]|uniref:tRNA threonylcarbamoyladenosine biosynthesis protein TsaE n=1 Tax=Cysteiniphilum litorale TaxID=2056700 RepID=A0A8J3E9J0_9GAMM|nr:MULTISPECIES: tRNA (adenosine(37)-N6)-threonylcarbamoyltransferase complex ATPase subunit type 1 TsaE [Cysteiniphilum]GGG01608.1 tRNA (adenosine(37)-N6)-threonylcarbamoyltransferase complex ATPase subunit type 1 TsaE [Cysteiniphilum litorale]
MTIEQNKAKQHVIENELEMLKFGKQISQSLNKGDVIYLHGDLGAGKTTLTKGILQGLGFTGSVKSPTYTLVETYPINGITLQHFDLYRLSDPEELEWIGIRDYFTNDTISLIEWPQKGGDFLPRPTKEIYIQYANTGRAITISD